MDLLNGTPINCLVFEDTKGMEGVLGRARNLGLEIAGTANPPAGVSVVKGEWPGVKLAESGRPDHASGGPTGVPWVDSNGWRVRLEEAMRPGTSVWVDIISKIAGRSSDSYQLAVADAAAQGGRWIVSLDDSLAADVASGKSGGLQTWRHLMDAAAFFASQSDLSTYIPQCIMGIISDFSGGNEFLSHELLNLVSRTNQQYRILVKTRISPSSFDSLRAITYTDDDSPEDNLRSRILEFVDKGGMLLTGPKWGAIRGASAAEGSHPRWNLYRLGSGTIAVAHPDFEDPYLVANDAAILISHRYELLRFWNAGAVGSYFAMDPGKKRAIVQMLFYAFIFQDSRPSVRVVGRYGAARIRTLQHPEPRDLEMEVHRDAVELHLPAVSGYAAVELEVVV